MALGLLKSADSAFVLPRALGSEDTPNVRVQILIFAGCSLVGCTASAPPAPVSPTPTRRTAPPTQVAALPRAPEGALWRRDVASIVDAGLGRFLQHVEVAPKLSDGTFRGFQIVALHPEPYWRGVDLQKGDVVTSINGMPIERETQAYAAFQALKQAKELRVSLERGEQARELKYRILDTPKP